MASDEMTEAQVREALWTAFTKWMDGQTVAIDDDGASSLYYRCDVERFCAAGGRRRIVD